jgi:hypothetical protein
MNAAKPRQSDKIRAESTGFTTFALDENAIGAIETVNNIINMTVVSKDENDLKAEYRGGFVQGKLQGGTILSARDNTWDNAYLTDPSHAFPAQLGPTEAELQRAQALLVENYTYFIQYIASPSNPATQQLKRLLFRMLGIHHGATLKQPAALDFSGKWLPHPDSFKPGELELGYETPTLTFLDVYLINAFNDLMDVISSSPEVTLNGIKTTDYPHKCSAFLKRLDNGDIILTHNSWMGFLSQTMNQTIAVNRDWITMNAATPGLIGSGTDFGYNNKGILFNETTHRLSHTKTKVDGIWIFWRSAIAEHFSSSIQEFFDMISIDNTGTYLNGYMLVDAKTMETGLVEMSYRCFVYYVSKGGAYEVTGRALDGGPCSTEYDAEMVTPSSLMGINFPASVQVLLDLQSTDNRPARWEQFKLLLPTVKDMEAAKQVITHTAPLNPLSIFGRWDLGYGITPFPKTIPDGSVDAKTASVSMAKEFMRLKGDFDTSSPKTGFYMLFGTPRVKGKPFIWSQSSWNGQKLRDVPDRLDGQFTLLPIYMK